MDDKVNLAQKFDLLEGFYKPAIVGYLNDYKLQIVKVQGPFVWPSTTTPTTSSSSSKDT